MTATTSKLGADMTDFQINLLASHYWEIKEVMGVRTDKLDAVGFARALLARQPVAIDKQEAVMWVILDKDGDLVAQSMMEIKGLDWEPLYRAAPLANEASKPAPTATCSVSEDCKWPNCRRDCVIKTDPAPSVEQDERGARVAAFKGWFKTAGIWNNAITQRAWLAACDWMQARAASTSANVAQGAEAALSDAISAVEKACYKVVPVTDWTALAKIGVRQNSASAMSDNAAPPAQTADVAQGAEAVAYRYRNSEGEKWYYGPAPQNWWECQALYAAPPAQTALADDAPLVKLFDVLMRQNIETSDESYLSLNCVGVPPTEVEFVAAVQHALTAAQSASASEGK